MIGSLNPATTFYDGIFDIDLLLLRSDNDLMYPLTDIRGYKLANENTVITDTIFIGLQPEAEPHDDNVLYSLTIINSFGETLLSCIIDPCITIKYCCTHDIGSYCWYFSKLSEHGFVLTPNEALAKFREISTNRLVVGHWPYEILKIIGVSKSEIDNMRIIDTSKLERYEQDGLYSHCNLGVIMEKYGLSLPKNASEPEILSQASLVVYNKFRHEFHLMNTSQLNYSH